MHAGGAEHRRPALRSHARRLAKYLAWVALALLAMAAARRMVPEAALAGAVETGGAFLQTFGSIYGVLVAFAMFVVWQQHNDTQAAVEQEAVALFELHRLVARLDGWAGREAALGNLRRYVAAVLARYGPHRHADPPDRRTLLLEVQDALLSWQPQGPLEERLSERVLDTFHELYEARERRTTVGALRLPAGLRGFVYFGGVVCVGTVCLLRADNPWVHAAFVAGMTWVVVAATSIVLDLDEPYSGDFVIDWSRFEAVGRSMERR